MFGTRHPQDWCGIYGGQPVVATQGSLEGLVMDGSPLGPDLTEQSVQHATCSSADMVNPWLNTTSYYGLAQQQLALTLQFPFLTDSVAALSASSAINIDSNTSTRPVLSCPGTDPPCQEPVSSCYDALQSQVLMPHITNLGHWLQGLYLFSSFDHYMVYRRGAIAYNFHFYGIRPYFRSPAHLPRPRPPGSARRDRVVSAHPPLADRAGKDAAREGFENDDSPKKPTRTGCDSAPPSPSSPTHCDEALQDCSSEPQVLSTSTSSVCTSPDNSDISGSPTLSIGDSPVGGGVLQDGDSCTHSNGQVRRREEVTARKSLCWDQCDGNEAPWQKLAALHLPSRGIAAASTEASPAQNDNRPWGCGSGAGLDNFEGLVTSGLEDSWWLGTLGGGRCSRVEGMSDTEVAALACPGLQTLCLADLVEWVVVEALWGSGDVE